jgi:ABC-type sulfate transport system permease component
MMILCKIVCVPVMILAALAGASSFYEFLNAFGSPQPGGAATAVMNANAVAESIAILLLAIIAWLVSDLKALEPKEPPIALNAVSK